MHHLSLRLDSFDLTKTGWREKPDKQITLQGEEPNEIKVLSSFLKSILEKHYPEKEGDYHILHSDKYHNVEELVQILPQFGNSERLEVAADILKNLDKASINPREFIDVFENSNPEALHNIAIAARYVQYKATFNEFSNLVENSNTKLIVLQPINLKWILLETAW